MQKLGMIEVSKATRNFFAVGGVLPGFSGDLSITPSQSSDQSNKKITKTGRGYAQEKN